MIKDAEKIKTVLARKLLAWYDREQRSLPWRETTDPYRIWVSEIMLQQTRVDTVIPYYHRFLIAFSTVRDLAEAPLQDVLKVWENLGYYARARNLHAAAGVVVEKFSGRIPDSLEDLKALPGVGDYAAGAILSIAYGHAVPAVDGNVRRILARLFALDEPIDQPRGRRRLHQTAALLVPKRRAGDFNQALMDLGATVCQAKTSACPCCPLENICLAWAGGLQGAIPQTTARLPIPHRQEAVAVIRDRDGCFLVIQRPARGLLGSLWKFPGGFIPESDNREAQLQELLEKELGLKVRVGMFVAAAEHAYTHFRTTLHAYEGRLIRERSAPVTGGDWRWVSPAELLALPLAKVDRMIAGRIFGQP
jgi:A/G-specific adenine glycosylase